MKKVFLVFLYVAGLGFFSAQKSKLPCYDLNEVIKVQPTPLYKAHIDASKSFNIKLLKNTSNVTNLNNKGKLVKVKTKGKGYKVQKLTHSRPYLVAKAKTTLEKMGAKFSKDNKGSTFTVSSITRTLEDQCRLRRVNSNASLGISSHNYGNSFDISYIRFNDVVKYNPKMEKALEKVLEYYRKAGRIYYIKEKEQSCYHITVRNY